MRPSLILALAAALATGDLPAALAIALVAIARRRPAAPPAILPATAAVRSGEIHRVLKQAELRSGDVVLVRPGARVPVDGEVRSGQSSVDESVITGESTPVAKAPGARVLAGSFNGEGTLEVTTERAGPDSPSGRTLEAAAASAAARRAACREGGALACAAFAFAATRSTRAAIAAALVSGVAIELAMVR